MRCQFRLNLFVDARYETIRIGLIRLIEIVVITTWRDFADRAAPFPLKEIAEPRHCGLEMKSILASDDDIDLTVQARAEPGPMCCKDHLTSSRVKFFL